MHFADERRFRLDTRWVFRLFRSQNVWNDHPRRAPLKVSFKVKCEIPSWPNYKWSLWFHVLEFFPRFVSCRMSVPQWWWMSSHWISNGWSNFDVGKRLDSIGPAYNGHTCKIWVRCNIPYCCQNIYLGINRYFDFTFSFALVPKLIQSKDKIHLTYESVTFHWFHRKIDLYHLIAMKNFTIFFNLAKIL